MVADRAAVLWSLVIGLVGGAAGMRAYTMSAAARRRRRIMARQLEAQRIMREGNRAERRRLDRPAKKQGQKIASAVLAAGVQPKFKITRTGD